MSLNFVGWAIGAPMHGLLSDRWRRRRAFVLAGGVAATGSIAALLYWPGIGIGTVAVLAFVNGLAASSLVVTYAAARELNPPAVSSAVYGLINTAVTGSGAIFQPLIGWLLDLGWDGGLSGGARVYTHATYDAALAVLPAVGVAGLALTLLMHETHGRQARS